MSKKLPAPRSFKTGRLLVVLPRLPSAQQDAALRRFVSELAAARELDLLAAGPTREEENYLRSLGARATACAVAPDALAARCRELAARKDYQAFVIVDHPLTRGVVEELRGFSARPIVLVLSTEDGGEERPHSPLSGGGFVARRREREKAARQSCAATEIWSFGSGGDDAGTCRRRARPEAAWLDRRLRSLGAACPATDLTSIIVPCFNGLRYTRECLEAVARHTSPPHEVIVVDNGSSDGTARWVGRRPGVRLIRNAGNRGFAKAINQGMAAAKGRYLVWLNSDAVVTGHWLERLIACAQKAPWIGAVGPCTDVTVGPQHVPAPSFRDEKELRLFAEAWALKHEGRAEGVTRLTGFCVLLKREAVRRVGELDERFGIGTYEEFDYCLRLRQAGYDLAVARDVFIRHHGHKSFGSFESMAERARVNRDVFLDKWCHQALSFLDELNPEAARA